MEKNIEAIFGIICSCLCYLFGAFDTPVEILIFATVIDYLTGITRAGIKKKVNSRSALKGFIKKLVLLMVVAFGVQLDKLIGSDGMIRNFVIYYYIGVEGLSILENCVSLGIPFPEIIKDTLEQIREGKK